MVLRNLTSESRGFTAVDFRDGREFTIYVGAHGCTEIQDMYIPNIKSLEGIFEIVSDTTKPSPDTNKYEGPSLNDGKTPDKDDEGDNEDKKEETPDEGDREETDDPDGDNEDPNKENSQFICDICNQEFASARGLSSHKNIAHLEE